VICAARPIGSRHFTSSSPSRYRQRRMDHARIENYLKSLQPLKTKIDAAK
jgi:hypothetical protein